MLESRLVTLNMTKFHFGSSSYPLNFVINDSKVRLYSDFNEQEFNANQINAIKELSFLVDVSIRGQSTDFAAASRHILTGEATRLKYVSHFIEKTNYGSKLTIVQSNDLIEVSSIYEEHIDSHCLVSYTVIKNIASHNVTIEYVSSFTNYNVTRYKAFDDYSLYICRNNWFYEAQWKKYSFIDLGICSPQEIKTNGKVIYSNTGAYSTKNMIPMGIIKDEINSSYLLWQIEANGSWNFELGDFVGSTTLSIYGPSFDENAWQKTLKPNESFVTVKVSLTTGNSENEIIGNITKYRRELLIKTNDHKSCPIIFNNYMHGDWNAPSDESIRKYALLAKQAGAEYFVIDCGWHDEEANPFNYIGKWNESKSKWPKGLSYTLDYLRSIGLKVGLWMEIELVGTQGDANKLYSEECYFHHDNEVAIFANRYQLDFRNKKVYDSLFKKVCSIIDTYKLDYMKFDYNCDPILGTSINSESYGESLFEHNKKVNEFMTSLAKKYPNLVIESCASGGNRLDYVSLAYSNLVSISDQDDYHLYPNITYGVSSIVLPEQAALWSAPILLDENTDPSEDDLVLMMTNSMIGRVHLAGRLYYLKEEKRQIIKEGLDVYKEISKDKNTYLPFYPYSIVRYKNDPIVYGLKKDKQIYLFVYSLDNSNEIDIPLEGIKEANVIFPKKNNCTYSFNESYLKVVPVRKGTTRLFSIKLK